VGVADDYFYSLLTTFVYQHPLKSQNLKPYIVFLYCPILVVVMVEETEKDMQDILNKKEKLTQDAFQCGLCGSIVRVPKGEKPTECLQEQGGCGKKHKKFKLYEGDAEIINQPPEKPDETEDADEVPPKKSKDDIKKEKIQDAMKQADDVDLKLRDVKMDDLQSNVYIEMDAYVDMVAHGISFGTLIEGRGGTGKTWRVINRLSDIDYAYTDSFTTPQACYIWLYRNRNKEVLIVDDVSGFMNNDKVLAFLKGGLWEVNNERRIHYMTTKPMQDELGNYVPNAFVITARMIIITNKLNKKNPHLNAVLTRVNYCNVEIDHEELMHILAQVAKKDYPGLTLDERMEVYNFIKDNTSEANDDLNIRSLIKCFQHKHYSKKINDHDLWKKLAVISIVKQNPALVVVQELLKNPDFKTEEERVAEFRNRTGRSRATYFRLKDQMTMTGDNLKEKKKE